jgi:hypothetical protein
MEYPFSERPHRAKGRHSRKVGFLARNGNAAAVAKYPPEQSGRYLLAASISPF